MKKLIAFLVAGILLFLSCAHKELTEEEREKYRRAREKYYRMQNP